MAYGKVIIYMIYTRLEEEREGELSNPIQMKCFLIDA
jgi:hypothetical protein